MPASTKNIQICPCPACGEEPTVSRVFKTGEFVAFCESHVRISATGPTRAQVINTYNDTYWGDSFEEKSLESEEDEQ